jgi:hypothetical protein
MSIYTNTARFDDSARALTEHEMFQRAPSVFARNAHESRSSRFAPIGTIDVIRSLQAEGFSPVGVRQSLTRIPGKADFTKHLIRLRKLDDDIRYSVGDSVCEILLKNANDGTSAYDLMAGLFRVRCLNSLVSQTATLDSLKIRHTGRQEDVAHKVIEGTYTVLDAAKTLLYAPQDWSKIQLKPEARLAYAESVHALRFGEPETDENGEPIPHAIAPSKLLTVRRNADYYNDLWTVFNVAQENAVRGGLHGVIADSTVRRGYRRTSTRPVNGIDQDIRLNKALWVLTAKMAELAA